MPEQTSLLLYSNILISLTNFLGSQNLIYIILVLTKSDLFYMRFKAFMAIKMQTAVSWVVMLCSLVTTCHHNPEYYNPGLF